MCGRPLMLCWTFWPPLRHFSQLMTGKYYVLICRTFSMHWTLSDQMSGNVRTLCQTSAEVWLTCWAYFAYVRMHDGLLFITFCVYVCLSFANTKKCNLSHYLRQVGWLLHQIAFFSSWWQNIMFHAGQFLSSCQTFSLPVDMSDNVYSILLVWQSPIGK